MNPVKQIGFLWWLAAALVIGLPMPAARAQAGAPAPVDPDTEKLNPGDKIAFSIEEDPQAGRRTLIVKPGGEILFPVSNGSELAVNINTAGKTLGEVKTMVKAALEEDYYFRATVRLVLEERTQRLGQVIFSGEVKKSVFTFDLTAPKTLFEALAEVGYSEWANLKKVRVDRFDPARRQNEVINVDIESVKKGKRDLDIYLRDGDRVEVPEQRFRILP